MTDPLWILFIGMVVVVGGVLWLRLHAFVALILGAFVVGFLTPAASVERYYLEDIAGEIVEVEARDGRQQVVIRPASKQALLEGSVLQVFPAGRHGMQNEPFARLQVLPAAGKAGGPLLRAEVISLDTGAEPKRGDLIVEPSAVRAAKAQARQSVGQRAAAEFGRTCASVGILIALAAIVGDCLLASGGADRIVRSTLRLVGERRAPLAFLSSGYLLGIPVFFDTVFYLLIPLGKAMRLRTGKNYLLYVLTIIAGATMTHSLVPPTPGPLAVAKLLEVDVGAMILAGSIVGLFTSAFGYVYAQWVNRRCDVPLRESADTSLAELEKLAARPDSELPSLTLSLLPILLPVVLIGGKTVTDSAFRGIAADQLASWQVVLRSAADILGDQNLALALSAAVAIGTLVWQKRSSREALSKTIQAALASGAVVILITSAGGAFGGLLRESGIGSRIKELALAYHIDGIGILFLAFAVTVLIRTAQGSATVAMITAAGILGHTFAPADLGFHPVYLALAIGCGSKPFAWMNDSGFWVICKMSGMTERETLRYLTPMTASMGFIGVAVTAIGAKLWPLVAA